MFPVRARASSPALLRYCSNLSPPPSKLSATKIVHKLSHGNYEDGIREFIRIPPSARTTPLHEAVIRACTEVPDGRAAEAVLRGMRKVTSKAVEGVIVAYCREGLCEDGLRIVQGVGKGVVLGEGVKGILRRKCEWNWVGYGGGLRRRSGSKAINMEGRVGRAKDLKELQELAGIIMRDKDMDWYVGLMTCLVNRFLERGDKMGKLRAMEYFESWTKRHVVDQMTGTVKSAFSNEKACIACVIATASKVLAENAMEYSHECLRMYDWIADLGLPGYLQSLPLQSVHFMILKYSGLPLGDVVRRIQNARKALMQLDERAFSMALAAILSSQGSRMEKLKSANAFERVMIDAGIAKTVQTYRAYAKELRDNNDAVSSVHLLDDMKKEELLPSAEIYSLLFGSFVTSGLFTYRKRMEAEEPNLLNAVLDKIRKSMRDNNVAHSRHSSLSLAMAFAHLNRDHDALDMFHYHLSQAPPSQHAKSFAHMVHTAAHARLPSGLAFVFFEKARRRRLPLTHLYLNALITAAYRTSSLNEMINVIQCFSRSAREAYPTRPVFSHIFEVLATEGKPNLWLELRSFVDRCIRAREARPEDEAIQRTVERFCEDKNYEIAEDILRVARIPSFKWREYGFSTALRKDADIVAQGQQESTQKRRVETEVRVDEAQQAKSTSDKLSGGNVLPPELVPA